MKVTSTASVDFPTIPWAITAGDVVELPEDKESQQIILAHPDIKKVKEVKK